ncbi:uncharacterized protein LACBIDRAFT_330794 [Laccaria bicolor S238N-H82]|uniref:Predicted protein n=1 Tax=Laccaria bicolor (strain S238N-H82 / ATCC MYA-4686) TaxID=486041 RepID=B0DMH6_LACBS|nr:uncharacterized protein LACBIDRAFT_330794 [Laccaria bicolor S238N-H82]EDR04187.1 predicted protein [Laccaria bicolor S238N-H82]|eukprot:XP_001885078.1 predicted protein [Laccaria bicolor S238N-H82]
MAKFNDVLGFLTRHPSIIDLEAAYTLSPAREIVFLDREQHFKFLTSLEMVSEVYPPSLYLPFDYNTFNHALYLLPCSAPHVTALHISFYPEAGIADWLYKHILQENSPLAALAVVTTLNLFLSWNMWRSDVRVLISIPRSLSTTPTSYVRFTPTRRGKRKANVIYSGDYVGVP